jgi:mannosyltransferase
MTNKHRQLLLVIVLLAVSLRFSALGSKSLWLDEAFSVDRIRFTQAQIWSGKYEPLHPPLYYSVLHAWVVLAGKSEVAVRLLSAFSSTLSLAVFYLLGRQLFGKDVAVVAVSLLAFSPLDLWYAQEARMYALVALTGLLTSLGLAWRHWLGVFLASIALTVGLYVDYTMVPLWVGISAVWFVIWFQRPQKMRYLLVWLISSAAAWGVYQPWLPRLQNMLARLNGVVFFNRIQSLIGLPSLSAPHYLIGMAFAGLGIFILSLLFSRWLQNKNFRQSITPVVLLVYASAILLFAVPRFYTIKRILVTGWSFFILVVAWIIVHWELKKQRVWQGLLVLSLLSCLVTLVTPKDDWRSVASFLHQNNAPEAEIWIDPSWNRLAYKYYDPLPEVRYGKLSELEEVAQSNEIWLIAERYLGQSVPSSDSEVWLDEHLQLEETISFYRLELRRYHP